MDPITIALFAAKGAIGLGKAVSGGIQKRQAQRELDKETPKYSRPEEYEKLLGIFQQQAGLGQLPGQDQIEAKLSSTTARGARAIGKYADNPVAAVAATAGLYGKEQGAIRDLGIQFAEFRNRAQNQLAGAYKMGADYSDKEFSYNQWYPDQMKRNMAAGKWNAGQQNLWGGIDMMGAAATDYANARMNQDGGQAGGQVGGQAGAGLPFTGASPAAVGSPNPTDAYGYYNPNLAGQFVPAFGIPTPTSRPGDNWGQWGSWAKPNNG
jgi:hypothetical protein